MKKVLKRKLKIISELEEKFWTKTELFIQNPYTPEIKTHKLSGKLKELCSFRIDFDNRVIFSSEENDKALFVDIGSHKEVY